MQWQIVQVCALLKAWKKIYIFEHLKWVIHRRFTCLFIFYRTAIDWNSGYLSICIKRIKILLLKAYGNPLRSRHFNWLTGHNAQSSSNQHFCKREKYKWRFGKFQKFTGKKIIAAFQINLSDGHKEWKIKILIKAWDLMIMHYENWPGT